MYAEKNRTCNQETPYFCRFSPNGNKINDPVTAETTFDLRDLISHKSKYCGGTKFKASGSITHKGQDAAGHYVATAVTKEGRKLFDHHEVMLKSKILAQFLMSRNRLLNKRKKLHCLYSLSPRHKN